MFPPPTTIAVWMLSPADEATWPAISRTTPGSIPYSWSPMSASPDSLSSTRRAPVADRASGASVIDSRGLGSLGLAVGRLPHRHPREARDADVLAEDGDLLRDEVADLAVRIAIWLVEEAHLLVPLVQLALDDRRDAVGRTAVALRVEREQALLLSESLGGHL